MRKQLSVSHVYSSIPCSLPETFRQSYSDGIDSFCHIYRFLAGDRDMCHLLGRFRLWPVVFVPRGQGSGDFMFARQIYWSEPKAALLSQEQVTDSHGRVSIQNYYENDAGLFSFFTHTLHVEPEPTIDDYLPSLLTIDDCDQLWTMIEIITELATKQHKEQDVRGR